MCAADARFAIAKFLLTIGRLLLHCWYSLGRPVTIGTPMVLVLFSSMADGRHVGKYSKCHNLLLRTKFHQNWFARSASRHPLQQNVQCAVARQRPLPHLGGHVGDMMGCDHSSWVSVDLLIGEL